MAYRIVIRKNGKHHGEVGPYTSKSDADADARFIRIKLAEPADVVVQRVEIGGVRYAPKPPSGNAPLPPMKPQSSGYKPSGGYAPKPSSGGYKPKFDLFGAEDEPFFPGAKTYESKPYVPPPPRIAAGGVVINDDGLILVREPTNHFDGYVWTLPKGGVDPGETDEQGALREVEEESGVRAEIIERIPGEWKGGTSLNRYFLMRPVEVTGEHDNETERIAFVTYDEAKELLAESTNKRGRERDLEVLDAGYALWLQRREAAKSKKNPRHVFA